MGVNILPSARDFLTALAEECGESRSETLTKLLESLFDACRDWLDGAARDWEVNRIRAVDLVLSDYGRLLADPAAAGTLRALWEADEGTGGGP